MSFTFDTKADVQTMFTFISGTKVDTENPLSSNLLGSWQISSQDDNVNITEGSEFYGLCSRKEWYTNEQRTLVESYEILSLVVTGILCLVLITVSYRLNKSYFFTTYKVNSTNSKNSRGKSLQ